MNLQIEQFSQFKETLKHLKSQKLKKADEAKVIRMEKEFRKQTKKYQDLMEEYRKVNILYFSKIFQNNY